MTRLLSKLMVKFVHIKHVKSKADIIVVKFKLAENQHDNQLWTVGVPAHTLLTNTDGPPKSRWKRTSLVMLCRKVINDLIVLNRTKRDELMYAPIVRPAERFSPFVDQALIKEEFAYY